MSAPDPLLRPLASDDDERQFADAAVRSFGGDRELIPSWFARAGRENIRVLERDGQVVGGLMEIPMGQFFLGKRVPMCGVAGVAIVPEHRGGGAGTAMMGQCVRAMRAGGFPISVLYASTFPLYRRAGWEHAGSLFEARLPLRLLPRPSRPPRARLETADDRDAIEAIYRARACRHHGWTDRGHYVWERIRSPLATQCEVLVVTDDQGTPSGYVMFMRDRSEDWLDVQVMDWCATSPGAVRDVVSVLANEASMGANLRIPCLPGDPLLAHLPERGAAVQLRECWMLRLNDVPAALNARGWPPGVRAEVNLDVEDPVVVENAGRWCITVEDGNVEVTAGGSGAIRIGVRALAPLYSGHATAETLALAGQLQGPAEDLADATRAFAAPSPTMVDFF